MIARRTPLRPVSDKRHREEREYSNRRRAFLKRNPYCEYPDCGQIASVVHHKAGRVGALYLDEAHWAALCVEHHAHVHANPVEAFELGLSERRIGGVA